MLRLPSFRTIDDVTVYADDESWNTFYLIPATPSLRLDDAGNPVFLLVKYKFGDEARERDPSLPLGGGYVAFDAQLRVPEEARLKVEKVLQTWVKEEAGRRNHSGPVPTVILADPTWSSGVAKMFAPQDTKLVEARVAEQPASLVSGNTAVFNMDLTEAGATFLQKTLAPDGSGSDLTPIQVLYDLKMWGRLPPVTITIKADSKRVFESVQKIEQTDRDDACTPKEIETYRETGVNSARLEEMGAIKINIDKGDASVSPEVLEELRKYAYDLFDSLIQQKLLEPAPQKDSELSFEDDLKDREPGSAAVLFEHIDFGGTSTEVTEDIPDLSAVGFGDKVSSIKLRAGCRVTVFENKQFRGRSQQFTATTSFVGQAWNDKISSVRVWRPPTTRYRTRKEFNSATMSLDVTLTQSQTVEWPMVVQATLESFFGGRRGADLARFVRELSLDDPMFQTLGLTVRVAADFKNEPISTVNVEVQYPPEDSGKVQSFVFDAESAPQKWEPSLVGGKRDFRYRSQVVYTGRGASDWSAWTNTRARGTLAIPVIDPGKLDVEVLSGGLDFDIVRSVSVTLRYEDASNGIAPLSRTIVLDKMKPTGRWTETLFKPVTQPVRAEVSYHLADDSTHEGEALSTRTGQLVIQSPHVDVLDVSLVPSGDWSEVATVVVSLRYQHPDGISNDATFRFAKLDEFATWKVLLQDPTRRRFEHQMLVVYKNGQQEKRDWTRADGDQAVVVHVPGVPKLKVTVLTQLVDFDATPVVTATVGKDGNETTLAFTAKGSQTWELPLPANADRSYHYTLKYHRASGEEIVVGPEVTSETSLFVPKLKTAATGKLQVAVRGDLVDYAVTPMVEVVLTYTDAVHGERTGAITLTASTKSATWDVDLTDSTARTFHYAVRYYLPDGTPIEGDAADTHIPNLIIKAKKPA